MKARIKLVANFTWEFAEIEFSDQVEKKMNAFVEVIKQRLLSVMGFEPKANIGWEIEIQQSKHYDLQDFLNGPAAEE